MLAYIHTAEEHVQTFSRANIGVEARHHVNEGWLVDVLNNGMTPALVQRVCLAVNELVRLGYRIIVCTCSSIAEAFDQIHIKGVYLYRLDRIITERALSSVGRVMLVVALSNVIKPIYQLISTSSCVNLTRRIDVHCVEHSFGFFQMGQYERYHAAIVDDIVKYGDDYDVIMLFQASMCGCERLISRGRNWRLLSVVDVFSDYINPIVKLNGYRGEC